MVVAQDLASSKLLKTADSCGALYFASFLFSTFTFNLWDDGGFAGDDTQHRTDAFMLSFPNVYSLLCLMFFLLPSHILVQEDGTSDSCFSLCCLLPSRTMCLFGLQLLFSFSWPPMPSVLLNLTAFFPDVCRPVYTHLPAGHLSLADSSCYVSTQPSPITDFFVRRIWLWTRETTTYRSSIRVVCSLVRLKQKQGVRFMRWGVWTGRHGSAMLLFVNNLVQFSAPVPRGRVWFYGAGRWAAGCAAPLYYIRIYINVPSDIRFQHILHTINAPANLCFMSAATPLLSITAAAYLGRALACILLFCVVKHALGMNLVEAGYVGVWWWAGWWTGDSVVVVWKDRQGRFWHAT